MDFFTNAGCKVVDATIATDPVSGAVKGFGYIEVETRFDLKTALESSNEVSGGCSRQRAEMWW